LIDVYLVPTGADRYELYCEVATPLVADQEPPAQTLWGRAVGVFRRALAEGERTRRGVAPEGDSGFGKVRRIVMRKIADAVAEQRLLWHLRRETSARLFQPDDLAPAAAVERTRASLSADRDKHRRWMIIDGLLTLASAPVALLPGPNFLAYYFIFRTVGHYLSMRGAQQGLDCVTWTPTPSVHLTELRAALPLDKPSRCRRIDEIAAALGLDELSLFVESMVERS
jgi:hypothetical protein